MYRESRLINNFENTWVGEIYGKEKILIFQLQFGIAVLMNICQGELITYKYNFYLYKAKYTSMFK